MAQTKNTILTSFLDCYLGLYFVVCSICFLEHILGNTHRQTVLPDNSDISDMMITK